MLLVGSSRYDVGTFHIVDYAHPVLHLTRRQGAPPPATTTLLPSPRIPGVDSILPRLAHPASLLPEEQYHRLFQAWGMGGGHIDRCVPRHEPQTTRASCTTCPNSRAPR